MKLIERKQYLDKMVGVIGTPDIKVLTDVRRSGKSKLLEAFKSYVQNDIPNANIKHINFNLSIYDDLKEYKALNEYVEGNYIEGKQNFVLIDEIQMCKGFELCINNLHATEAYNIYITGSNAFLLSSDLATLFTGRVFEIKVYPFSFAEYVDYFGASDKYNAFDSYMLEGGMSGSYVYKEQEDKYDYIETVFDTLILRDIRQKYKIKNSVLMDRITQFLMDNVSNLTSARSIADTA
ncbi:MAG: ATP-binding protein, partial [Clostridia bacterium]|nr:ATP-binding protein [Clostridia bacterium]